jgi:hypothetical protein
MDAKDRTSAALEVIEADRSADCRMTVWLAGDPMSWTSTSATRQAIAFEQPEDTKPTNQE